MELRAGGAEEGRARAAEEDWSGRAGLAARERLGEADGRSGLNSSVVQWT
jgi:hypothetical protein